MFCSSASGKRVALPAERCEEAPVVGLKKDLRSKQHRVAGVREIVNTRVPLTMVLGEVRE